MTSLSQSFIWQNMHEYYDKRGPEVWQDEVVPLHITTNKYLANIYANIIVARINDSIMHNALVDHEPITIIELGVGHGRFSYYLLKKLLKSFEFFSIPTSKIRYIMTDISTSNIDSWKKHHALKSYIDLGILDFAHFNPLTDNKVSLQLANYDITYSSLSTPLFVIGNYLFDTLPHDAFKVKNHTLYEAELVVDELHSRGENALKLCFEKDRYQFNYTPVSTEYYKNKVLDKILADYAREFDEAVFNLPIGAINCIENLKKFTKSATLFLISDKGDANAEVFRGEDKPEIAYHGSVSMSVNFNALASYTTLSEGVPLMMGNRNTSFQISGFSFGNQHPIMHTQFTFDSHLSQYSPQDLFNITYTEDDDPIESFNTLDQYLALMHLSDWDPTLFYDYYPSILEAVEENEDITQEQDAALLEGLPKVWEYFFKLESSRDIPFAIGCILYQLDYAELAVKYYEYSLEFFGEQEETYYNLALAYQMLEEDEKALHATNKALKIKPNYEDAKALLKELNEPVTV